MHIEPGIVQGAKLGLGFVTAVGSLGASLRLAFHAVREDSLIAVLVRSVITSVLVFGFFEVLPNYPLGVSEVHFILGSTLFLLFGTAAASIGLAVGLTAQGLLLAPADLPQLGMNITSLLVPLFGLSVLARKIIPAHTAYKDIRYRDVLLLSTIYQAGVISWVTFWVFYGQGFSMATFTSLATFASGYLMVILIEPLLDVAVLAGAKTYVGLQQTGLFHRRLYKSL